jgi:glucokinase
LLALGVDIGGTKIAAGLVTSGATLELLRRHVVPTRAQEGFDVSIGQLWAAIDGILNSDVTAIGICAPGPLNPKTGVVLNPPNLPGWRDVPLARIVSERYDIPCSIENDANAAGLAETHYGAAIGYSSVLYVTISTGIGTGIVLNGRIYHGKNGAAGEGGHVTIDYRGRQCCCGVPGCIEAIASGTALAEKGRNPSTLTDADLDELTEALAAWLGSCISLLDPEIIVIGGGLTNIGAPLFDRLRRQVPSRTINQFASATPIVPARLAGNVGILGAAAVVSSHGAQTLPPTPCSPIPGRA